MPDARLFSKNFDPMASPVASGAGAIQRGAPSVSDPLQMFIPLRKADAAQRLIYGYATAELPDRSGEICDYASTKPYYEQWSADFAKASGGKSLGNLRAMHGKVAAERFPRSPSTTTQNASRSPPRSSMTTNGARSRKASIPASARAAPM